jgi:hypothetical protein
MFIFSLINNRSPEFRLLGCFGERQIPVKNLDVTFEHWWLPMLRGCAQPLIGGDETLEQRQRLIPGVRFAPTPSSAVARAAPDSYASLTSSLSAFDAVIG